MASYAVWYVVRIYYQNKTVQFPDSTRDTLRFDHRYRKTPGFRIKPFEFPVVPFREVYTVGLLDEYAAELPNPKGFGETEIVPLLRVGIDSGRILSATTDFSPEKPS